MRIRTFMAVTALSAITLITLLALWRDNTKTTDVASSSTLRGTAAPRSSSTLPPAPPAGLPRSDEVVQRIGNLAEPTAQHRDPPTLSSPAPEPIPSTTAPTTSMPDPTIKDATEGAKGTPPREAAAIPEKPSRPAKPSAPSATASLSPPLAGSESTSDKVTRMQLAASMQGLEPGPPIHLPIRLGQGQVRTIYFFTELRGLNGRSVLHRWEWNGRVMQERQLQPASQSWRTYTGMGITGDMKGSWRVSAVDAASGKILAEQRFNVE